MTIVDHTRDHDLTVAGTQAACGWALHLLATERHHVTGGPLPVLSWVIRNDEPRLCGLIYPGTSEQRAAAVNAWAAHLGAQPTTVDSEDGTRPRLEFDAVAHGVEIHVHTYLDAVTREAAA